MESTSKQFQELVIHYFKSRGNKVDILNENAGLIELREQNLYQGLGRATRIVIITDVSTQHLQDISSDVDFVILNDSPLGAKARSRHKHDDSINLDKRLGHIRHYYFGRDILFSNPKEWLQKQLKESPSDLLKATLLENSDNFTGEWTEDYSCLSACRALICSNKRRDVSQYLEQTRITIVENQLNGLTTSNNLPFLLPMSLQAFQVRSKGFLTTLRESLRDVFNVTCHGKSQSGTSESFSDEFMQLTLQLGYIMPFIDHIEEWSIDYDLDPNRGTFTEFLLSIGKTGTFLLGCDKYLVFHFLYKDILQKDKDNSIPIDRQFKTLGERFFWDSDLKLLIIDKHKEKSSHQAWNDINEVPLPDHWKKSRGLLGNEEFKLLIHKIGLSIFSTEVSGYLGIAAIREIIDSILPDDRTLKPNTDHVFRILLESGLFEHDPALGIRFKDADIAESIVADALKVAINELWEFGKPHSTDDLYLKTFCELLSLRQMNDRLLYNSLKKFGGQSRGFDLCKQLWGERLKWLFTIETSSAGSLSDTLPIYRCSLLKMANILKAWIKIEGDENWSPFSDIEPNLSRIVARQLYLYELNLTNANLSASALPFLFLDNCLVDKADFSTSYLVSSVYCKCSMDQVNFEGADLSGAYFDTDVKGLDVQSFKGTGLWATVLSGIQSEDKLIVDRSKIVAKNGEKDCRFIKVQSSKDSRSAQEELNDIDDPEYLEALMVSYHYAINGLPPARKGRTDIWRYPPFWLHYDEIEKVLWLEAAASNIRKDFNDVLSFDAIPSENGDSLVIAIANSGGSIVIFLAKPDKNPEQIKLIKPVRPQIVSEATIKLMGNNKGVVVCWDSKDIQYHDFLTSIKSDTQERSFTSGRLYERVVRLLPVIIGQKKFFIFGGEDGGLSVYGLDEHARDIILLSSAIGNSIPTAIASLSRYGQVLVAREDSSFDIFLLDDTGNMLKQTSFLLAHDRIHTIITDPLGDKYLIIGVSKHDEETAPYRNPGTAHVEDFDTLVALCNADCEVLAVWPWPDPEKKPEERELILDELPKRIKDLSTQYGQEIYISSVTSQKISDNNTLLEKLGKSFKCEECKVIRDSNNLSLEYSVSYATDYIHQLGADTPLFIDIDNAKYYLSYSFSVKKSNIDTKWSIPMSEITVEDDICNSLIKFKFSHPLLTNELKRFSTNEVNLDLAYPLLSNTTQFEMVTQFVNTDRINPFEFGPPVSGASFYGYEKEIEKWAAKLLIPTYSLTITGARRMGKSSFRLQLEKKLSEENNVVVVQFDIDLKHTNQSEFYRSIVDKLKPSLDKKHLTGISYSPLYDLCDSPSDVFFPGIFAFLENHQIANPILILMLDEFGKIYGTTNEETTYRSSILADGLSNSAVQSAVKLFDHLSELVENYCNKQLRLVLVGLPWHFKPPIDAAHSSGIERYFNKRNHSIHIGQMDSHIIDELIKSKLKREDVDITSEALLHCHELTSAVPNDVQLIMYWAFENALIDYKEHGSIIPVIEKRHVEDAKINLIEHYEPYYNTVCTALDQKTNDFLIRESRNEIPIWERDSIKLNNNLEFASFDKMGYWNWHKYKKILFIPRGLTLLIRETS